MKDEKKEEVVCTSIRRMTYPFSVLSFNFHLSKSNNFSRGHISEPTIMHNIF